MPKHASDSPTISDDEFLALKRLLSVNDGPIGQANVLDHLERQGFIRRDHEGWSVTLEGHIQYLRKLGGGS